MKAIVEGTIKVAKSLIPKEILNEYTYLSPSYDGMPTTVLNYYETDTEYWFPRNLHKFKALSNLKLDYNLTEGSPIELEFNDWFDLYPHQYKVHDYIIGHFKSDINCLVQAPTRFGKAAVAIGVIKSLKVKTLILVDKTLLVEQFIEDGRSYSTVDIGKLEKGKPLNDVTVTTFQFLNKNLELLKEIKESFGLVIVDELHVSAAVTYKRIINSFPSRYRLGLTATPSRSSDNLTGVLYDLFGTVAIKGVNPNDMEVQWYNYKLPLHYKPSTYNPAKSYNEYFLKEEVTMKIMELIDKYKDKTIMIATNSKLIQNHYTELSKELGLTTCVFNSDAINKKVQSENLEKVKDGTITLFSGLNVLLKGISIPKLEVVINLMSIGSEENLTQLLGRLKTKYEGKTSPLFINVTGKFGSYKTERKYIRNYMSTTRSSP